MTNEEPGERYMPHKAQNKTEIRDQTNKYPLIYVLPITTS